MQQETESRRLLLRVPTRRERRRILLGSAGYSIRTLPPWMIEPIGGFKKVTPGFIEGMKQMSYMLGQHLLRIQIRSWLGAHD